MRESTSLRLPVELKTALGDEARREGLTVSELAVRLLREGLAVASHPGIVFKGGPSGRRASLAGGPDVWEVIADFRLSRGRQDRRVQQSAKRLGLHEVEVIAALKYASDFPDEIADRIEMNETALRSAEASAEGLRRLLA